MAYLKVTPNSRQEAAQTAADRAVPTGECPAASI